METPSIDPASDEPNPAEAAPRDGADWAKPTSRLKVQDLPPGAINLNLEGRQLTNPMHGFGQLWRKTYKVRLSGVNATSGRSAQDVEGKLSFVHEPIHK